MDAENDPNMNRGLMAIVGDGPPSRCLEIIQGAVSAGFASVMIRAKQMSSSGLFDLGVRAGELIRETPAQLIINDRLDVALALPHAGGHVGARGIPVESARKLLGPRRRLGYSAHSANEAVEALNRGADYVTLSPLFRSVSKPGLPPRGLSWFKEALTQLPPERVVALGGVQEENLRSVAETGCAGAAMIGALAQAADPKETAAVMIGAWRESSADHDSC